MNKEEIISNIIQSNIVEKVTNSLLNTLGPYKDDFIQEMYLIILELPDDKLFELYNKGQLYFYIVRILRNQAINSKSKFSQYIKDTKLPRAEIDEKLINNLPYE